jgi:ADP-heptose:LPS heptosyltransferase
MSPPDPPLQKIAVLRANAIGDLIFTLPALEALRAAYPRAEIVLLGQEWHADFLTNRPGPVDRVIVVPPIPGISRPESSDDSSTAETLAAFFARMQTEHFDLALQLHGGGRHSNAFVKQLGARLTAGLKTPDAPPLDRWVPYIYYQSEILRFLEVVSCVGAPPVTLEPRLALIPSDEEELSALALETGRPWIALHPGAGDPRRRWPVEKFAAIGDTLARTGALILVTGTERERSLTTGVLEAMQAPAISINERLSLGGLAALLAHCSVVVSNDSGPLHLAGAVGAPTVGLYWCGNLINAGPMTRTRHRPAISWRLTCPQCGRNIIDQPCGHAVSFIADIPAAEIVASALELFQP